jgi:hypothetical protein
LPKNLKIAGRCSTRFTVEKKKIPAPDTTQKYKLEKQCYG